MLILFILLKYLILFLFLKNRIAIIIKLEIYLLNIIYKLLKI